MLFEDHIGIAHWIVVSAERAILLILSVQCYRYADFKRDNRLSFFRSGVLAK
jgi:hypothetical protein